MTSKTIVSPQMGITAKLGRQPAPDHSGKTCAGKLGRDVCAERATCRRHLDHQLYAVGATVKPLTLPRVAGQACHLRVEVA